jgi:hypothetical protein
MDSQIGNMTKDELLRQIRFERQRLEETLAHLTHAQMLLPGVDDVWSVKDALAHISAWERRMLAWVDSHLQGQEPAVPLPWDVDRMNAETYVQVKDKELEEVLEEFHRSFCDSLVLTESLTEKQLKIVYSDTWPMGPLWTGIAANTHWHYKDHNLDIQKWIESQNKEL